MTNEEAVKIIKSECYIADLLNLDRTQMVNTALDLAVKALEQQPCEDCISRKETIEWLKKVTVTDGITFKTGFEQILYDIEQMPSVTLKAEWIHVSERLPEENEYIGDVCKYYLIQDEYGDMHVAHLSNVGWIPINSLKAIGDEVIAWMPLPEPYVPDINVGKMAESEDRG